MKSHLLSATLSTGVLLGALLAAAPPAHAAENTESLPEYERVVTQPQRDDETRRVAVRGSFRDAGLRAGGHQRFSTSSGMS